VIGKREKKTAHCAKGRRETTRREGCAKVFTTKRRQRREFEAPSRIEEQRLVEEKEEIRKLCGAADFVKSSDGQPREVCRSGEKRKNLERRKPRRNFGGKGGGR